ncbi:MAG: cache domain-containing protein [Campylobacterales bacterium]|nr:cache domain-containing protein [Campylobacterales bacterium]
MKKYNEKYLLRIITWAPISFIFILSLLVTYIKINDTKISIAKDISQLTEEFIEDKNNKIKIQVNSIYKHILYNKKTSEKELKDTLKSRVYEAHAIASNIYKENNNKSREKILKLIKDALRDIRFNNNRSYFFIHNIKGTVLLYPLSKRAEGTNYSQLKDLNGYYFVQTIMKRIRDKKEGFDIYYWEKPDENGKRIYKKFIFTKYFKELNISISTGEYIDDYETQIKSNVLKYINNLSLEKKQYYFLIDNKNVVIAHSNKTVVNKKLKDISFVSKNVMNTLENKKLIDNTFLSYTSQGLKKISYVKYFKDWDWLVGTGYYYFELAEFIQNEKEKLEQRGAEDLKTILLLSLLATSILFLLSYYLSSLVRNRFITYKNELLKEIKKNREKDSVLSQQSKMAAMGEMLANIAHQWRQPLSVISTASSGIRLKKEFNDLSEKEMFSSLSIIDNSAQYLSKTIDDFTNFFSSNKKMVLISTNKLWDSINTLISAQFKYNNIEFILDIKKENVSILANELIQVLLNIVNNSKDQFLLSPNEKRLIFVSIKLDQKNFVIEIKDNAGGINEDIISRVFEPYFTTKHQSQGTGIGLYMCEQIVSRNLKGTITAINTNFSYKDENYKGASFIISIPSNIA